MREVRSGIPKDADADAVMNAAERFDAVIEPVHGFDDLLDAVDGALARHGLELSVADFEDWIAFRVVKRRKAKKGRKA